MQMNEPRLGLTHPFIAPYGVYPSSDDVPVLISIQNDREFERLCHNVIERPGLEKDPKYALAFSGLAETYVLFSGHDVAPADDSMPLAKAAALRALEIDDSLAEAHTALGYYLTLYEFDLDRSEKEFRRAIELKPDYATAHQWFAANLTVVKRFDESLAEGAGAAGDEDAFTL